MVGGSTFSPLVPVLGLEQKPASATLFHIVHGGRYDTIYVMLESMLHAAFVADTILGAISLNQFVTLKNGFTKLQA